MVSKIDYYSVKDRLFRMFEDHNFTETEIVGFGYHLFWEFTEHKPKKRGRRRSRKNRQTKQPPQINGVEIKQDDPKPMVYLLELQAELDRTIPKIRKHRVRL